MTRKDFDFYQHVYEILKRRYRSAFIPYHEVYSYLGRMFCLKKGETCWDVGAKRNNTFHGVMRVAN